MGVSFGDNSESKPDLLLKAWVWCLVVPLHLIDWDGGGDGLMAFPFGRIYLLGRANAIRSCLVLFL